MIIVETQEPLFSAHVKSESDVKKLMDEVGYEVDNPDNRGWEIYCTVIRRRKKQIRVHVSSEHVGPKSKGKKEKKVA